MFDMLNALGIEKLSIMATLAICAMAGSYLYLHQHVATALRPLGRLLNPFRWALVAWNIGSYEVEYVGRHRAVTA